MIYAGISRYLTALAALLLALIVGYCLATIRARVSFQFMTISVLLDGLEIGDYSLRGRRHRGEDSLDGVVVQVNRLADELARQRASAKESRLLLEKVIRQIGVAILAFDDRDEVVLANPSFRARKFSSRMLLLLVPRRCLRRTTIQWSNSNFRIDADGFIFASMSFASRRAFTGWSS
jgi:signal transduction histidine kinase